MSDRSASALPCLDMAHLLTPSPVAALLITSRRALPVRVCLVSPFHNPNCLSSPQLTGPCLPRRSLPIRVLSCPDRSHHIESVQTVSALFWPFLDIPRPSSPRDTQSVQAVSGRSPLSLRLPVLVCLAKGRLVLSRLVRPCYVCLVTSWRVASGPIVPLQACLVCLTPPFCAPVY